MSINGGDIGFAILLALTMPADATGAAQQPAADNAFQLSANLEDDDFVMLIWSIAPGYRLYQKTISVSFEGTVLSLAMPKPTSVERSDAASVVLASLPVLIREDLPREGNLVVRYRGCSDAEGQCSDIMKLVDLGSMRISEKWVDHG